MIISEDDPEVLTDALWAFSYLSDGDEERIDYVIETNIIPRLLNIIDIILYIMCNIFVGVFLSRNCEYDSAIAVFLSDALKS